MRSSLAILFLWICFIVNATTQNGCPEPPKVQNALVSQASVKPSYSHGDEIDYTCDHGYVSLRKISYMCNSNSKWIRKRPAECTLKRCELPADISNGRYTILNGDGFVLGTTIKYTCKDGYQIMSRFDTRTCRQSGWDNQLPVCEEIFCDSDVPPDRHVKVEGLPDYGDLIRHGHTLQFSCEKGQILRGHKEITCQQNGEWSSPFPKCEEITCLLNETEQIKVERISGHDGPIKPGDQIELACNVPGMIIRGPKGITCQADGEWSHPFPKCEEATCVANLTNMNVVGDHNSGVIYKPGERIKVSCVQTYGQKLVLQGKNDVTCQADGEWSSPFPSCVETFCPPPPNLSEKNADTSLMLDSKKTEYNLGERVHYTCFKTYQLEGDPYLTCEQGRWKGNFTCVAPCLASVDEMDRRNIVLMSGGRQRLYCPHLDHITFVCKTGKRWKKGTVESRQQCLYGKMTLPECV